MTRPVTMSDLARALGVSRSAVSFALNNENQVSEETRRRVVEKAAELGYRPNAGARALASQTTGLYGLVTDIVTTPFAGDLIAGAQETFWRHGKSLIIAGTNTPDHPDRRSVEMMLEHRVGGVLFATTWNRTIKVPSVLSGVPMALVHCSDIDGHYPSVLPDEVAGGYEAGSLLADSGRKRIAMINLPEGLTAAEGRRVGFERALNDAGLAVDPALIVTGGADATDGYRAAKHLLQQPLIPDGIFCANDRLAMGAYDAIREAGLRIPEDIGVVGFDNQELISSFLRPALTTISLPFREMGRIGAELLMQMERGEEGPRETVVVNCPTVIRESI
ncbi:LacI family DNA-binding transcriptional regulator [Leifsonia sp. PS1209]|uniref:LacI family DNA-binding transcriptional regulator n=1 Tax=Leifsonia sp. PS1209 TaxID=2724914 RepID=UPI001442D0FB|nr:LacI family DNA-binding transcriptional regulator [Leifsonia sp. PS1209]QJA00235.1 substrate-binding domain-containing protein [Leifsonia sp. PS1209]